jgi:hypothetical protein
LTFGLNWVNLAAVDLYLAYRGMRVDRWHEALFVLSCARTQMGEDDRHLLSQLCAEGLDWEWIVRVALQNRVGPLLYLTLRETGLHTLVPAKEMKQLENSYYLGLSRSTLFEQAVREVLLRFEEAGIGVILLRGLVLGETIYKDPALRPFSDMDLLIRKQDLARGREALLDLGYRSAHSIDEKYFERNHLHLQYLRREGGVVAELHWALDHKYTVFNIDYTEIFDEALSGQLAGVEALLLPPENLLLSLCIHLIKHCYYTKYILPRPDFVELILSSGLILYCDIAEVIRHYGPDLDWDLVVREARHWQVEPAVQPALASVAQLFDAPVPQAVLESLPPPKTGWLEGKILALAVEDLKGKRAASRPSHPLRKLLDLRSDLMFRPVRTLDLLHYLWPAPRFVARRYNASNPMLVPLYYGLHLCKALGEVFLNLVDLVYYTRLKRHRS